MRHLIIGSGRMARHFDFYLSSLLRVDANNTATDKRTTISHWNRTLPIAQLQQDIQLADKVWLLISDSALAEFFETHLAGLNKTVIHFSGALHIRGMIAAHPLMTFSTQLYTLDFYKKIPFVLSEPQLLLSDLDPHLSNPSFFLSPEQKPLYHALCVLGGNLPHLLWQKMRNGMLELGLPDHVIDLYLEKNLENFKASPQTSLTGPLARKDFKTIEKNLNALGTTDPYQHVYQSFVDLITPTRSL